MELWEAVLTLAVLAIVLFILRLAFLVFRANKHVVLSAVIDIYPTGKHHVEFMNYKQLHPVDLVQLVVSYISNIAALVKSEPILLKQSLTDLIQFTIDQDEDFSEVRFRKDLERLAQAPPPSLKSNGKYSRYQSDRFRAKLSRNKFVDFAMTSSPILYYRPNLSTSCVALYCAAARQLEGPHLRLVHKSLLLLLGYMAEEKLTPSNHQLFAFSAVSYMLNCYDGVIEPSPGRFYSVRKNSQGEPPEEPSAEKVFGHSNHLAMNIPH